MCFAELIWSFILMWDQLSTTIFFVGDPCYFIRLWVGPFRFNKLSGDLYSDTYLFDNSVGTHGVAMA